MRAATEGQVTTITMNGIPAAAIVPLSMVTDQGPGGMTRHADGMITTAGAAPPTRSPRPGVSGSWQPWTRSCPLIAIGVII